MVNRLCTNALAGFGLLVSALSMPAHAQPSPKTVTLVVPFAAGGGTDTVARLIGEQMSRTLGQTVIVENVVGGGSTLANDRVAIGARRIDSPDQSRRAARSTQPVHQSAV
jgi:tripartite-type tricarboxylate transporter receptor subunit TctC